MSVLASKPRTMPLIVAIGTPSITTLLGLTEVMMQSRNSSFLKVQSVPVFSASWTLNLVVGGTSIIPTWIMSSSLT